jgi:hypothetical protein
MPMPIIQYTILGFDKNEQLVFEKKIPTEIAKKILSNQKIITNNLYEVKLTNVSYLQTILEIKLLKNIDYYLSPYFG